LQAAATELSLASDIEIREVHAHSVVGRRRGSGRGGTASSRSDASNASPVLAVVAAARGSEQPREQSEDGHQHHGTDGDGHDDAGDGDAGQHGLELVVVRRVVHGRQLVAGQAEGQQGGTRLERVAADGEGILRRGGDQEEARDLAVGIELRRAVDLVEDGARGLGRLAAAVGGVDRAEEVDGIERRQERVASDALRGALRRLLRLAHGRVRRNDAHAVRVRVHLRAVVEDRANDDKVLRADRELHIRVGERSLLAREGPVDHIRHTVEARRLAAYGTCGKKTHQGKDVSQTTRGTR